MSSIQNIDFSGANQINNAQGKTSGKSNDFKGEFSEILAKMKEGKSPMGGTDNDDSSEKTVTMTQVLSDGSILVTVYKGNEMVSQTKTRAANAEEKATIISSKTEQSVTSGLNGSSINSAEIGAELNVLLQS